jgi:hypothetical protein
LGLERAQNATGDKAAAAQTDRQLLEIWKSADPGYAAREQVQRNLSAVSRVVN